MSPTYGALFAGMGGLELGVQAVLGGHTLWHSEFDAAASRVLAHHWPDVPNLGDITEIDWDSTPRVNVLTGGSPCQDVSSAGARRGMKPGTRSGLWASMSDAIQILKPDLVVWENVRGVLSAEAHSDLEPCPGCVGDERGGVVLRALGRVLGDLANIGYDAWWCGLRAADVGAPHGRYREFVYAWPTGAQSNTRQLIDRDSGDTEDTDLKPGHERRSTAPGQAPPGRAWADARGRSDAPSPHSNDHGRRLGFDSGHATELPRATGYRASAPDPTSNGRHEWRAEPTRFIRRPDAPLSSASPAPSADRIDPRVEQVTLTGGSHQADDSRRDPAFPDAERRRRDRGARHEVSDSVGRAVAARDRSAPADTDLGGLDIVGRVETVLRDAYGCHRSHGHGAHSDPEAWGAYAPAVARWETISGRAAPAPTEPAPRGGRRLAPEFPEWMMGLPPGHVTAVPGVTRSDQLKIIGDGVCPQQAAAATAMFRSCFLRENTEPPR